MPRVHVNVSGRHFEFDSDLMQVVHEGRLKYMVTEACDQGRELAFTIDRSADSFTAILTYYQTGKLHLPTTVCPRSFLEELEFWELSYEVLSECCYYRLHSFLDESETRENFKKHSLALNQKFLPSPSPSTCSNFQRFRHRLWAIVDFQESTLWAKLYYLLVITMVMTSILSLALSTDPRLKRSLTKCELLEYLKYSGHSDYILVKNHFKDINCNGPDRSDVYEDVFQEGVAVDDGSGGTRTITLQELTVPSSAFSVIEIVFVTFFSVDIMLRMFSCPSIARYFLYMLNVIDALALVTSCVLLLVENIRKEHQYEESWIHILQYFQILRALRLLRVVNTFRASQVLAYSIRENIKDLLILALFLFLALSTFSCLIYFAESRSTIPSVLTGWYWSIITLTTVGYGDIVPKTSAGRVIAGICAVLGIVLMAVTVPIFVNNFLSLYNYAIVDEFVEKKRKEAKQKNPVTNKDANNDGKEDLNIEGPVINENKSSVRHTTISNVITKDGIVIHTTGGWM